MSEYPTIGDLDNTVRKVEGLLKKAGIPYMRACKNLDTCKTIRSFRDMSEAYQFPDAVMRMCKKCEFYE